MSCDFTRLSFVDFSGLAAFFGCACGAGISRKEGRERVKGLFASLDMETETFAKRFALSPAVVRRQRVALPGGAQFVFEDYERAQSEATEWLRDHMEYRLGMASFVENFIRHVTPEKMRGPNGGQKWTPERTLKSFTAATAQPS